MKLSLDVIGYGGYFTAPGEKLGLEEAIKRAAKTGYDAACIYAHRPLGFPMDLDTERRKKIVDLYQELELEMGAVVCCTNFMQGNHVLLYPQEKEIMYVKECIKMAKEMGSGIVRILSAFYGYFQNPHASTGYGFPAFESRSKRVSRAEDWLEAWHEVRSGLTEVAQYAEEQGILLALQTHPEILGNNDEALEILNEVNVPSLKIGLDLPLLESQDPDFIRNTVHKMKDHMVYSHTISLAKNQTIGGAPYSWEEVAPGSEKDPMQWEVFIQALKEINYEGLLSAEICSPVVVKGHKLGSLKTIDERYAESLEYMKGLLLKHDCYTGQKDISHSERK
ncbi:sugar phosphate isomerase/epimerase family protein [Negadavirga shengliensis]|uniref:Sugar phosphate isomerase/epimerase family protein n=1 Tax=Negadavirga shengliensis TaxID=1389218 RepID=A0ABV9T3D2_9BACT